MAFTTLAHHLDVEWMREAFRRTRKDAASGVDGKTAADYEAKLEENFQSLLERAKSGTYHAPPVRWVFIPKGDGKQVRPIGIPTFEDKILQRAVAMLLEAIYEQDHASNARHHQRQTPRTLQQAARESGEGTAGTDDLGSQGVRLRGVVGFYRLCRWIFSPLEALRVLWWAWNSD